MLSKEDITNAMYKGELRIGDLDPYDEECQAFQPASVDLTLGNEFRFYKDAADPKHFEIELDPVVGVDEMMTTVEVDPKECYVLKPQGFCLSTTAETVELNRMPQAYDADGMKVGTPPHRLVAKVEGRSSWGRIGVCVHITAGFIDPGFRGQITLEMFNFSPYPVRLRPGVRVCQLSFERLLTPVQRGYHGKYQDQKGVQGSRIERDG